MGRKASGLPLQANKQVAENKPAVKHIISPITVDVNGC